jgi:hypothetical protein
VGVEEVRWEKGGTDQAEGYTFFYEERNGDHQLRAGNRVDFISDRMSIIILRRRWCRIIFLKIPILCEDKSSDIKDKFYEEPGPVFVSFLGTI